MNIEELVSKLREEGHSEEEIKATLLQVKADIDAYLGENEKHDEEMTEDEAKEKRHDVFGY